MSCSSATSAPAAPAAPAASAPAPSASSSPSAAPASRPAADASSAAKADNHCQRPGDRVSLSGERGGRCRGENKSLPNLDWLKEPGTKADQPDKSGQGGDKKNQDVTIQPWGSGKNDSVWGALKGAGWTDKEIVEQKLVQKVADQNGLKDPNIVQAGQVLQIPRHGENHMPVPNPRGETRNPNQPGPRPTPTPTPTPTPRPAPAPSAGASDIGTRALGYGVDSPKTNPNNGTSNWNGYCLGWVNNAVNSNGGNVSELRTGNAKQAYEAAKANERLQYGNPPEGAIVFFPNGDPGGQGHVGLSLGDGQYRGTVPASENASTIGDRAIPGADNVAWMMPY